MIESNSEPRASGPRAHVLATCCGFNASECGSRKPVRTSLVLGVALPSHGGEQVHVRPLAAGAKLPGAVSTLSLKLVRKSMTHGRGEEISDGMCMSKYIYIF